MKKLVFLFAIAGALTACNNDSSSSGDIKDSLIENVDSIEKARKDSIEDSTDRVKERIDNSFDKTDSANKALADSTKKG
jgi:hypothetical protein